jgi:uroporphyrinogen decarboxylase
MLEISLSESTVEMAPSRDHLLLRAARGETVERVPVWAMRQAGRWDPDFLKLRDGLGFYEFSEDVRRSADASLCPVRFGVDAIILFYDITTLPVAMGLPFSLKKDSGPQPSTPVRTLEDVERLTPDPSPASYQHIRDLLATVKRELAGKLPVIVFAGAPFTVATYCIGTGKDITATRRFAAECPAVWDALRDRLRIATGHFLRTLIAEGADIYQLFDSWAGLLTHDEYRDWAARDHAAILAAATGVPRILFVKECKYLDEMATSGADVISVGRCIDLRQARAAYPHLVFQGNVDEAVLRTGTPEQVRAAVHATLDAGGGHRHILNLNHGVGKETPVENFEAYIAAAMSYQGQS